MGVHSSLMSVAGWFSFLITMGAFCFLICSTGNTSFPPLITGFSCTTSAQLLRAPVTKGFSPRNQYFLHPVGFWLSPCVSGSCRRSKWPFLYFSLSIFLVALTSPAKVSVLQSHPRWKVGSLGLLILKISLELGYDSIWASRWANHL